MTATPATHQLPQHGSLRFLLTDSCNIRCDYCHNEFQGDRGSGVASSVEWDAERVSALVRQYLPAGAPGRIKFSGGEPLLRKGELQFLIDVVAAERHDVQVTVFTNMTRADESTLLALSQAGVDQLHVNLPSWDPGTYQRRTHQRFFRLETLLSRTAVARSLGMRVQMNMVTPPRHEEPDLKAWLRREYDLLDWTSSGWDCVEFLLNDWETKTASPVNMVDLWSIGEPKPVQDEVDHRAIVVEERGEKTVLVARCTDWQDSADTRFADIYVQPPGRVMSEYIKGRAYRSLASGKEDVGGGC